MPVQTLVSIEEYLGSAYEPDCDYLDSHLEERNVGEWDHSRLQGKLCAFLIARYEAMGIQIAPELRIRVKPTRFRVPDISVFLERPRERVPSVPPFVCVEILSLEDRMSRMELRITDYLEMGVAYVWVLDPETRQAYVATAVEGLREVKSGVLTTQNPVLEVPLNEVWS